MKCPLLARTAALIAIATVSSHAAAQGLPQPSAEHEIIKSDVGVWDAESTFWMAPGAPPMKSKCVETNKMLGPMWVVSKFEGDIAGMPFTGHAQLGYDPAAGKFIATWIDSMSPYMGTMEGDYDPATKTLTMIADGRNMETGEPEKSTNITRWIDEDTKVFTIHQGEPGADGKPAEDAWKMMEIRYTRRK